MKKLPIGIQNIREIITDGYTYVDKTQFALDLIENGKHYFLSRPRRFGKSLFVSTLEEIFKANKSLFEGCHIYQSNYDWQPYPMVSFNFGAIANDTTEELKTNLHELLTKIGKEQGVEVNGSSLEFRLEVLVEALAKKGPVVVLIDEYDKPIIDHSHNEEVAEGNRRLLQSFFGVFKNLDKHIKFTFITGISRFSKVSLFSGANHLKDISMDARYANIAGYTYEEMVQYFDEHLQAIAQEQDREKAAVLAEIKAWYNGYRFTEAETYVYNPFSTLNYFDEKKPKSYWYASGTPTFLIPEIRQRPQAALSLSHMLSTQNELSDISRIGRLSLPALMFQTGYLTIQDYDAEIGAYQLDFPNQEVRGAFFDSVFNELTEVTSLVVHHSAKQLREALGKLDLAAFVSIMNTHFARIPFHASQHAKEGFYQALFLTFLELSGLQAQGEVVTNKGRIDVMCALEEVLYIFELKVDQEASIAMAQAQRQEYSQRYRQQGRKIVVMGISFSSSTRDIAEWQGDLLDEVGELIRQLDASSKR
ncbi:MAG: AAA family ATPase [Bacteroidota bacterium]